jgi:hypothetical protein
MLDKPWGVWCVRGASCALLLMVFTGCESLERKFTRKPKTPLGRPSPIVQFQDYSHAMTPMDRYRKHYAIFNYWNSELLNALSGSSSGAVSSQGSMNEKRVKRASTDSLGELRIMRDVMAEDLRPIIDRLVEERAAFDQQLQAGSLSPFSADRMRHALETQTRQIHRDLYWRKVQGHLKGEHASPD